MTRTAWLVYILSSANTWVLDSSGTFYTPNDNLELPKISTGVRTILADGTPATMSPENKSLDEAISFLWKAVDLVFVDLIRSYIDASYMLKLDDGVDQYIGKFVDVRPVWLTGQIGTYDIVANFQPYLDPT